MGKLTKYTIYLWLGAIFFAILDITLIYILWGVVAIMLSCVNLAKE